MNNRYRGQKQVNVSVPSQGPVRAVSNPQREAVVDDLQTQSGSEEPILDTKDTGNAPIVIALPPWVGALNPKKLFSPVPVLLLIIIAFLGYTLYNNRSIPDLGLEKNEDVAANVVAYDFEDLEEDQVTLIKGFVAEMAMMPEKEFKSKAKIMATLDLDSFDNDEARLTAVNEAMKKAYDRDAKGVASSLAALIKEGLMDETGEYMTAISKKTKPKKK